MDRRNSLEIALATALIVLGTAVMAVPWLGYHVLGAGALIAVALVGAAVRTRSRATACRDLA